MSQTLVISTPEAVSTTSRTFPKQGMFNLKITKNGTYDTVEIWFRSLASGITLELAGASFQSTEYSIGPRVVPPTTTAIGGSTLTYLTAGYTQYIKIKLNQGITVAYLRCSYDTRTLTTIVTGGNVEGQAFVDYSKKPYINISLERMFAEDSAKNDLTKWDVSSVKSLIGTFENSVTFNQDIGNWDTSNVTNMFGTFSRCYSFNQDISGWDTSKVTGMSTLFFNATNFNQPIGNWDTSNVTDMGSLFSGATAFNQDLSSWNVSNANMMYRMFFNATNFNQPIGNWDVRNVTSMEGMFIGATNFNQDLSSWAAKFQVDVSLDTFFESNTWGTTNYDKFLNALWVDINTTRPQVWASRTKAKILGMGTSKYSVASAAARAFLVTNGWTITDGGLAE